MRRDAMSQGNRTVAARRASAGVSLGTVFVLAACSSTPSAVDASPGTDVPSLDADVDAAPEAATDAATDGPVGDTAADAQGMDVPAGASTVTVSSRNTRFVTMDHMLASLEMQQSGEPLAQAMGRNLAGYNRYDPVPNHYQAPNAPDGGALVLDLPGYATAIESYEYSKQPMNNLAFESGAGLSLAYGPLDNPMGVTGTDAQSLVRARVQHYALASRAGIVGQQNFVVVPAPTDNPLNPLGWSGFWPTFQPFRSFDPTIRPASGSTRGCSLTTGYGAVAGMAQVVGDYECGYTTLHLPAREDPMAVEKVLSPGTSGWTDWKWGLWIVNYLQIMHDSAGNPIDQVPEAQLTQVGTSANSVLGRRQDTMHATDAGPGVFLGSSDIEGFQGAFMLDALDNQAWQWLSALTTADGTSLGGFASLTEALAYDYQSPLRWFPGSITVTENARDASGFPRPTRYALTTPDSRLLDLLGMLGGFAEVYSVTDRANGDVGGAQAARAYFDGDPFAMDNGLPDGESTLHDRALAVMKFVLVSLDRLHREPSSGLLVDQVTFTGGTPIRGSTVSTVSVTYTLSALRTLRRSLGSGLTLYSNSTPDTDVTRTPLDDTSFRGSPGGATPTARVADLIHRHAELLYTQLTSDDGSVRPGWNVVTGAPTPADGDLDAYAAALRGVLEAYLATGESRYRDRAEAIYARMETVFYAANARAWRSAAGPTGPFVFTPLRFALMDAALREYFKLVASRPGHEAEAISVENHIARLVKLVLNGWDDRNQDGVVQYPSECTYMVNGLPAGGLQMAERALTGETGLDPMGHPTSDRDHDCVPEISAAFLPSALASEIVFTVRNP